MPNRRHAVFVLGCVMAFLQAAVAAPPVLLSAVSRVTHGNAGAFDVTLPLAGGSGVECRSLATGTTVVLTFNQPVATVTAAVTGGKAKAAAPSIATNVVSVKLTDITDAQTVTLNLDKITNAAGEKTAAQTVKLRVLLGDINGDGRLTAADANLARAAVGKPVGGATFRADVTPDGQLTTADSNQARTAVGRGASVAGGQTTNTPPTITQIANQTAVTGVAMNPVGFTVGDAESDPATLVVTATSSDPATVPNAAISIGGTGESRAITLTPVAGVTVTTPVTITLVVSDGLATSDPMSFVVSVTPPPVTYLAQLKPIAGVNSLGSGSALLTVSGDGTYAIITYSTTNLTSAESDETVNDDTSAVLYDLPVGRQLGQVLPDGSFKWTFNAAKAADIRAALASQSAYFHVETSNNPAGEVVGTFKPLSGSQTFTPPADAPPITINPPTSIDASRFLQQAAFGGTAAEIAALSDPAAANASTAIDDWLTAQFNQPKPIFPDYSASKIAPTNTLPLPAQSAAQPYTTSSLYWNVYNRVVQPQAPNAYADTLSDDRLNEAWWKTVVTAPDPLRHRVATALSEILVVSENDTNIDSQIPGLATYYDMLADDAFGNFRTILYDLTLHPIMGQYLTMRGSLKTSPNENYAREIMQLFSVGLYMLQPDGTLMLDSTGRPIPTYTQAQVTSMSAVYTGWNYASANYVNIPTFPAPTAPATTPTVVNFQSRFQAPMVVTATNHSTIQKGLLQYPGVATIAPATTPGTIAATTTASTASANAELNATIDNIFNHPNVGPFISKQLIQRLVLSNPSPGYVYRVAQKFNDNGSGVRGDMKAVITAILTDYEARSPTVRTTAGYGKMREPVLRVTNLMHSMKAVSKTGKWAVGKTDTSLSQTIFRAPTVFNFFDPSYSQPGAVQQAGLVSPEFQIIYETTVMNAANMFYTGVYANYAADGTPALTGTGFGGDVYLDHSTAGSGLVALNQTQGTPAMIDQVILMLNGGPLDKFGAARMRILQHVNTLGADNHIGRVQAAVHLVASSAQAAIQK